MSEIPPAAGEDESHSPPGSPTRASAVERGGAAEVARLEEAIINGRQALERLAEETVDLILTDFMMPDIDGPGLLRAVLADDRLAGIPVVMMSSLPEARVAAAVQGHVAFLRKPFRVDAVSALVEGVLKSARQG